MGTQTILLMVVTVTAVNAASAGRSVQDRIYSDAQAQRGEATYAQYCVTCHGRRLKGDEMSPSLSGGAFTTNWNASTVGDLLQRIQIEMPLDQPGVLTREQSADLVAFILKANGWPSGPADLPADLAALKQIRMDARQP